MKFKIIAFPTPSKIEKIGGMLLILVFFSAVVLFFFANSGLHLFILLGSILLSILIFNILTSRKFDVFHTIKNSQAYIEFNRTALNYSGKTIEWEHLTNIKLSIKCYKGKDKSHSSDSGQYYGYEVNFIEYEFEGTQQKHFFYIKNRAQYLLLKNDVKTMVLPILYRLKNIKYENILITKLEYKKLQEFKKVYDIKHVYDEIIFNKY